MSRTQQITAERRRRETNALAGRRRRLSVNEEALDRENFVYRFANDDDKGRIHMLTVEDDWEVVSDRAAAVKANADGDGSKVSVHAGTGERGAPLKAVLLRKPKAYHDEDYAARQRHIDETEAGLRNGVTPGASTDGNTYVPKGGISLSTG